MDQRIVFSEEAKAAGAWPDEDLRGAFVAYWTAVFEGKREEVLEREAAYVRQLIPQERYLKTIEFLADPKKVKAVEVGVPRACSPYLYEVPLRMKGLKPTQGLPTPGRLDYWVKTDGGWQHAVKYSLLFPELGLPPTVQGEAQPTSQGKEVTDAQQKQSD